jgi:hypothetical protein
MNRSTAMEDQERSLEEGLEPLQLWMKRWIDDVIQIEFGYADLEFAFVKATSIDPLIQSEIDDRDLRNGSRTIDEVRHARGDDPLIDGLGAKPMIYTTQGAVLLDGVVGGPNCSCAANALD